MASSEPSQEVLANYQKLTQECQQLQYKLIEFDTERNEHKVVEETLKPLDPERRAFRLVGGVLVERTVKEVLPSVTSNRENLDKVVIQLQEQLAAKQKETAEFKAKYNLTESTSS